MSSDLLLVIQGSKSECAKRFTLPVHSIINDYIDCISYHLFLSPFIKAEAILPFLT